MSVHIILHLILFLAKIIGDSCFNFVHPDWLDYNCCSVNSRGTGSCDYTCDCVDYVDHSYCNFDPPNVVLHPSTGEEMKELGTCECLSGYMENNVGTICTLRTYKSNRSPTPIS